MSTAPTSTSTVDAALRAAAGLTGMELVFLAGVTPSTFTFLRVYGEGHPSVVEGASMPRADSFCSRMLDGAPNITTDAAIDPAYADSPFRTVTGTQTYIGVPVVTSTAGVIGTLCAIDARTVPLASDALVVLRALAEVIAAGSDSSPSVRVRRTSAGWQVEPVHGPVEPVEDLTVGMALADLLTPDLIPPARPPRPAEQLDEPDQLRVQITQLQHALAARVVVEQAIGVLAERLAVSPREAFERLRKLSRSRGQRVHDLARLVVASVNNASVPELPRELR
ncbi:MAG TPA: ANTAR domain-containing protein [Frankiaceae bacterium]|nr:ANTAR domain-containing protein [Frankiaceae bacterium]